MFSSKLLYLVSFMILINLIKANERFNNGNRERLQSRPFRNTDEPKSVLVKTNLGDIEIELFWREAPKTCKNFAQLAKSGYYDNTIFHRIIDGFMIQGGDPTGTGRGGTSIYGEKFEDEFNDNLRHTGEGIVSMANSGPNTNGSQFFITLAPTPHLDGKHTIFGKVRRGLDVVMKMGKVDTDRNDKPIRAVKILSTQFIN